MRRSITTHRAYLSILSDDNGNINCENIHNKRTPEISHRIFQSKFSSYYLAMRILSISSNKITYPDKIVYPEKIIYPDKIYRIKYIRTTQYIPDKIYRTNDTWTKHTGQDVQDKLYRTYILNKIYRKKCNGQNIPYQLQTN